MQAEPIDFAVARRRLCVVEAQRAPAHPVVWPILGFAACAEATSDAAKAGLNFGRRAGWWR